MRAVASVSLLLLAVLVGTTRAEDAKAKTFSVQTVKKVAYYTGEDADPVRHKLDLFLPEGHKNYPVFFFIHGGGWTRGSKEGTARHGATFAKHGIGFVTINYRLTKHPEHIEDVARAFAWAHANLGKYGANTNLMFISGHSAGGHLAALLATDESYLKTHKLSLANIKGVVPVSGVFDVRRMSKLFGDAQSSKAASPLTHVRAKLPPMLILYGDAEENQLGRQAKTFGAALSKAKSEAKVEKIAERDHGTIMRNIAEPTDPATLLIFEFINKHSGASSPPPAPKS